MGIVGYAGEDIGLYRRSGRRQGAGSHFPEFKFPMFSGNMGADVVEQEAFQGRGAETAVSVL